MATEILQFDYRHAVVDADPAAAAAMLRALCESGVNLIGFSEFPHISGAFWLDLVLEDTNELASAAVATTIPGSAKKTGFLIRGENLPRTVIPCILQRLTDAGIAMTSLRAVSVAEGRFGAMLRVKPQDVTAAAKALAAVRRTPAIDLVEIASEGSFPASDPPAWAASRTA
jgi:hypothetical protein